MNIEKIRKRFIPMTETMLYILLSLREEQHGYGVMLHVKELTNGRILLGAGTTYQSLKKLETDGLIRPTKEIERKKLYVITKIGEQILGEETIRIREIYKNLEGLL
ncbi:MAG: PadR family transcriptional regulator [Chloroflexi bacterium]|jgi:DNA-binding PadR family transcriptional regulator|nr:PadR family transcriptional regulator [Chloroflexota bacterium]